MPEMCKINFKLEKDEDGFPPVAVETLWADPSSTGYTIDSIPFFTKDVANGDIVSVKKDGDGSLWFDKRISSSGHSLIRLIFFDHSFRDEISFHLKKTGCSTEYISDYEMMSVDIPENVDYQDVLNYIGIKAGVGVIDYEEAIIRQ